MKKESQTTPDEVIATINRKMLLDTEELKEIDDLAMRPDSFDQEAWNDFYGSDEINDLIYMAHKLNALLKAMGRYHE